MVNRVIFYAFVGYKITLVKNEEGKSRRDSKRLRTKRFLLKKIRSTFFGHRGDNIKFKIKTEFLIIKGGKNHKS